MGKSKKITVQDIQIRISASEQEDYICITDIAKLSGNRSDIVLFNYMRNKNNIEFLGLWEELNNSDFNPIGFDGIRSKTGLNSFNLSVKEWINQVNARGIRSKAGRYGGTYAHKDIAIQFTTWLSPKFYLYVIKEFDRLKSEELQELKEGRSVKRMMASAAHSIHTESIKTNLIPPRIISGKTKSSYYSSEVDLVNLALFGMTAREWGAKNPELTGNMRDHATADQLLVLSHLQSLNANLIKWDTSKEQRLEILNETAIRELEILSRNKSTNSIQKKLE